MRAPVSSSCASSVAVAWSRWPAGSSRTRTGWSASRERATPSLARSPPESPAWPSPSQVSEPSRQAGQPTAQPGLAERVARPPASVALGRASRTFSTRVVANTCGSSSTSPVNRRTSSSASPRRSWPPCHSWPDAGSRNRTSSAASVLLPEPEAPTSAMRSPGSRPERALRGGGAADVPPAADADRCHVVPPGGPAGRRCRERRVRCGPGA